LTFDVNTLRYGFRNLSTSSFQKPLRNGFTGVLYGSLPLIRVPTSFLTVKEAALRTGKSVSSIRRIIYPVLEDDQHADRNHIEPSVDEARRLRADGTSFPWRLSEELLRRSISITNETGSHAADSAHRLPNGDGQLELLAMLRRELDIKNQQILQQSELIAKQVELLGGLGERIRESNILIGSLQKHLSLTDGRDQSIVEPTKSKATPAAGRPEKGSGRPPKSSKTNRSFLSRIFRPKK
jgi:hypothetical protein